MKIMGLKVGSSLITADGNGIDVKLLGNIARQIYALAGEGYCPFIVSSGAVASDHNKFRSKNLRAGVGMPRLMANWIISFEKWNVEAAQMLLLDRDLLGDSRVIRSTLLEAFREGVVPIINANDVVDSEELKALDVCADNDRLFGLVCRLVKANFAIIAFDQDGVIDSDGQVIHEARQEDKDRILSLAGEGNACGHSQFGMRTKVEVLFELASNGIWAVLAPGRAGDFILRAARSEWGFGTTFLP